MKKINIQGDTKGLFGKNILNRSLKIKINREKDRGVAFFTIWSNF